MKRTSNDIDSELIMLCRQGEKLGAIKLYKETTGASLKQSKDYVERIIADHGIQMPAGKSACFIATACYGDYNAYEVVLLRNYRDQKLMTTFLGRIFVKVYYKLSPWFAKKIERSERSKSMVRNYFLAGMIRRIEKREFDEPTI